VPVSNGGSGNKGEIAGEAVENRVGAIGNGGVENKTEASGERSDDKKRSVQHVGAVDGKGGADKKVETGNGDLQPIGGQERKDVGLEHKDTVQNTDRAQNKDGKDKKGEPKPQEGLTAKVESGASAVVDTKGRGEGGGEKSQAGLDTKVESNPSTGVEAKIGEPEVKHPKDNDGSSKTNEGSVIKVGSGASGGVKTKVQVEGQIGGRPATVPTNVESGVSGGVGTKVHEADNKDGNKEDNSEPRKGSSIKVTSGVSDGTKTEVHIEGQEVAKSVTVPTKGESGASGGVETKVHEAVNKDGNKDGDSSPSKEPLTKVESGVSGDKETEMRVDGQEVAKPVTVTNKVESGASDGIEIKVHEADTKDGKDNDGSSKHNNGSALNAAAPGELGETEIVVQVEGQEGKKSATLPTKIESGAFDGIDAKVNEVDNKDGKDNNGNGNPNEASVVKMGSGGSNGAETDVPVGGQEKGKSAANRPEAKVSANEIGESGAKDKNEDQGKSGQKDSSENKVGTGASGGSETKGQVEEQGNGKLVTDLSDAEVRARALDGSEMKDPKSEHQHGAENGGRFEHKVGQPDKRGREHKDGSGIKLHNDASSGEDAKMLVEGGGQDGGESRDDDGDRTCRIL
jgi:hypothetical protein